MGRDLSEVEFRRDWFEALVDGYLEVGNEFLTPAEIDQLVFSGLLITFEIGIRFLADYLDGDVYFKTHRPGHNLDRARVQFHRVVQVEGLESELQQIVARYR